MASKLSLPGQESNLCCPIEKLTCAFYGFLHLIFAWPLPPIYGPLHVYIYLLMPHLVLLFLMWFYFWKTKWGSYSTISYLVSRCRYNWAFFLYWCNHACLSRYYIFLRKSGIKHFFDVFSMLIKLSENSCTVHSEYGVLSELWERALW